MFKAARTKFCAICLAGALTTPALVAQRAGVDWQVPGEIGADDRRAILAIARAVGMRDPRSVSVPLQSRCLLVTVESSPVLLGNRVSSEIVAIRKKTGPECPAVRGDRRLRRQEQGNWIAFLGAMNPRRHERWRISDDDWHVDLTLGDVAYSDAVMIVDAIRRRQLVDRRPPSQSSSAIQYIDAGRIISIRSRVLGPDTARQYEITEGPSGARSGGGQLLIVRIDDGRVELRDHIQWMP